MLRADSKWGFLDSYYRIFLITLLIIPSMCKAIDSVSINYPNYPSIIENEKGLDVYLGGAIHNISLYAGGSNLQCDFKNERGVKPIGYQLGVDYSYAINPSMSLKGGVRVDHFDFKRGLYGEEAIFSHVSTGISFQYQLNGLLRLKETNFFPYGGVGLELIGINAEKGSVILSPDLESLKESDYSKFSLGIDWELGTRFYLTEWISLLLKVDWIMPITNSDWLDLYNPSHLSNGVDYPNNHRDYKFSISIGVVITIKGKETQFALINARTKKRDQGKRGKINKKKLF